MQRNEASHPVLRRALLALTLLLGILSCTMRRADVPINGWWASRGPVVPHDTFPADCTLCHKGGDWHTLRSDFEYDHAKETGYALEGAHAAAECLRCHNDRGPVSAFVARGCAGCHEDIHQGMAGNECTTCHEQGDWRPKPEIANHSRTRFPLIGAHAATACWRCHTGAQVGRFDHADPECISCHASDLTRATNPDHLAQGWTSGCDRCHIPTSWDGAGFNHAIFPLTGKHATTACAQCHPGGQYTGTPQDCYACHASDYNGATSPNHVQLNISTQCQTCHSTSTWDGANFNHVGITSGCVNCHQSDYNGTTSPNHAANNIPLQCETCHSTNDWHGAVFNHTGISSGCVNCHQQDYNGTTNPNHAANNIPLQCENCHSTTNWLGATFDHTGIANGCVNCHQSDYNGTTNPNHTNAGFPTSCENCHDTINWDNGTFQHSFPITSGKHNHFTCVSCHTTPTNYQLFSCINCHEHNQQQAGSHHSGTPGYVWQSPACYNCHPHGN